MVMTWLPHSGGSDGPPLQTVHRCAIHAGGNSAGQGHAPVAIAERSAWYRDSPDTLMAAPALHKQSPVQIIPVEMLTQSEL